MTQNLYLPQKKILYLISFLIVTPIFFQIGHGLFQSADIVFNSNGNPLELPLPISLFGVFIGLFLLSRYLRWTSFLVVFVFLITCTISFIATSFGHQNQLAKLLLICQYFVPMMALVLGDIYGTVETHPFFELTALLVLNLILFIMILTTWSSGYLLPKPTVLLFSVYQHIQYFPTIVSGLLILIVYRLWGAKLKLNILIVSLIVFSLIYLVSVVSISPLINLLMAIFLYIFLYSRKNYFGKIFLIFMILIIVIFIATYSSSHMSYIFYNVTTESFSWKSKLNFQDSTFNFLKIGSIVERVDIWGLYLELSFDSLKSFLFGHHESLGRGRYSSAHNYWLDLLYNFGFISLLPLLIYIGCMLVFLVKFRHLVVNNPRFFGLAYACIYLVLCENFIKVGMRQPYPGVITFFLLGMLTARLNKWRKQTNIEFARVRTIK